MATDQERVGEIYQRLGQGMISTDDYRPLQGDLVKLLWNVHQAGDYYFPFTNMENRSQHDYRVSGFIFSMVQQSDGTWLRVDP